MKWHLNIDTGGTFTDCIAIAPNGETRRLKILSNSTLRGYITKSTGRNTYKLDIILPCRQDIFKNYRIGLLADEARVSVVRLDPQTGILETSAPLSSDSGAFELQSPEEVPLFAARILTETGLSEKLPPVHLRLGTTRGTNALLERKGSTVILITTKGFKDILKIGTQQRPDLFSLHVEKPEVLYDQVIEISERVDREGTVLTSLTESDLNSLSETLNSRQAKSCSLAISLLNSFQNPNHEFELKTHLKENNFSHVTCSSDISRNAKYLERTETTVVNAYLKPTMDKYLQELVHSIQGKFYIMTSAGHLSDQHRFLPKDALLSGPAGGVAGAVSVGQTESENNILSFDMGGTSTDVSLYAGDFSYTYLTQVGAAQVQAPSLQIDTIAAGGGSICSFDGKIFRVGPESAGADPGPACYGAGGPLTISDINLLSGRLVTDAFSIPVSRSESVNALQEVSYRMPGEPEEKIIQSFQVIANERMAETIRKTALRKGLDPSEMTLVAFGGAGGQHACDIAELLNSQKILIPFDAGLLSAYGISRAEIAHFSMTDIYRKWPDAMKSLETEINQVNKEAIRHLLASGYPEEEVYIKQTYLSLRFLGQETSIEIKYESVKQAENAFENAYRELYGHWLDDQTIELVSIKSLAAVRQDVAQFKPVDNLEYYKPPPLRIGKSLDRGKWIDTEIHKWEELMTGAKIEGPAVVFSTNSTAYIKDGWTAILNSRNNLMVNYTGKSSEEGNALPRSAQIRLFLNRFSAVAEDMGAILERTSFSVNIKERFDFSCALLDRMGNLIVNAPHIPVHLGSMGLCVQQVIKELPLFDGDIAITNHPAFGGSHLPDVTLIAPIYIKDELAGYVANRAHHAEIGGMSPGSMPPNATRLVEEGVVIHPMKLVEGGIAYWDKIREILGNAEYPSRSIDENIADLRGSIASIYTGIKSLKSLCYSYDVKTIREYMEAITDYVAQEFEEKRKEIPHTEFKAKEFLDDGSKLNVRITNTKENLEVDFTGTSGEHPHNLNATPAIVQSVVIYIMRLILNMDLPLNDGLLRNIRLTLPHGLLNPDFNKPLNEIPAVVGGNTEVSQRLTDTLLKALDMAACSQGTMNNLLFGNDIFGFYETICGGTGAIEGYNGTDAVHQHMTNTRITDPEILELRYPVRLECFRIRQDSGGSGKWYGGNGVKRKIRFLTDVQVSILSQHRKSGPYGLRGGEEGSPGYQYIDRKDGNREYLEGCDQVRCKAGDAITILTPGGGGWGHPE